MKEKDTTLLMAATLNVPQMRMRCPHATILGTANLKGWELLFKGSKTGSYLTIEECAGGMVPVVIWEVTAADEAALDRYEGFPISTTKGTSGFSTKASARGSAGR